MSTKHVIFIDGAESSDLVKLLTPGQETITLQVPGDVGVDEAAAFVLSNGLEWSDQTAKKRIELIAFSSGGQLPSGGAMKKPVNPTNRGDNGFYRSGILPVEAMDSEEDSANDEGQSYEQ